MLGKFGIVRNDEQCRPGFGTAIEEKFHDFVTRGGIEIAGRLIGEDQVGTRSDCTGDGDTLLLAAAQLGFFRDQGLDVTLQEEVSWANIRDKVIVGQFDGAHMLAPMVMASTLGLGSRG